MAEVKDYPPYLDYPIKAKPKTNADRIRAMSDEELCEFLMCDPVCDQKMSSGCEDCKKCIMEWLQQPAEEERCNG